MPVKIGDNLTLEDNKLSAVYKELYTRLNRAYAWTHTQSTSSGGTAVILCNGQIINNLQVSGDIIFPTSLATSGFPINTCIIDKKVYNIYKGNFRQIGTYENIKEIYRFYGDYSTFVDENNNIYHWAVSADTPRLEITISNVENYTSVAGAVSWGGSPLYIADGKLYNRSKTQLVPSLTKCQCGCISGSSTTNPTGYIINDGYLYYINGTSNTLIGNSNNWIKFLDGSYHDYYSVSYCLVMNSNKEIYKVSSSSSVVKGNFPVSENKIKKFYGTCFLTTDGEIYYGSFNNWKIINSSYVWSDISKFYSGYGYGISDGKLYYINCSNISSPVFTQLGTETGYTKIDGCAYNAALASNDWMAVAYTGVATTVENTVFTTKNPLSSDDAYFNTNNFTNHSTISSVTFNTITDQYRTYTRDASKDSSFINIPGASAHETITAIDLLAATNPSN